MMDTAPTETRTRRQGGEPTHPSAPLPEVGPPVANGPRVALGRTGLNVFPFALGTAEFARLDDARASTAILDRYVQSGGNVVHVADRDGETAALIGDWIRSRGIRDDVVIAARIAAPRTPRPGTDDIATRVARLLESIRTDRLDLVTIDVSAQRRSLELEQALSAVDPLLSAQTAGALGAYGVDATHLLEARVLASAGYPRIDVLETPYGLGDRSAYEGDLQNIVAPQHIAVMPVHAVPRSLLAHDVHAPKSRLLHWRGRPVRALEAVSRDAGLTRAATALAWARTRPAVGAPIVDAFAVHHIDDLAPAAMADLTRAQTARLDRAASR